METHMNLTDLKEDFYKRFSVSESFLSYSRSGLLCPLLGYITFPRCAALTCSLSMKVQVYGRRIEGNLVKLQSTKNNLCVVFHYGGRLPSQHTELFDMLDKMHGYGVGGAELFFDCTIPEFFKHERELKTTIFKVMSNIYDITVPISVCGDYKPFYSALLNTRKGYCLSIPRGEEVPLPLTGSKLLIVQTQKQDKTPRAKLIEKAYEHLKRVYPHIHSFADVSADRLEHSKNAIRDKTALNYARHIVDENDRMQTAAEGLKKCNINALIAAMNLSEESIEKLWNPEKQHVFLARLALSTEGVSAARIWENGIIAIADEEALDDAVSKIKFDFENTVGYKPFICIADTFGE